MAPICKGVKADGTVEDCKCHLYREEVREDIAAPGYCNYPTCRHHIGGHVKLQPSLPSTTDMNGMKINIIIYLF